MTTPPVPLDQALSGRANSFGVIRLVLAASVIFSHAFPIGGWGSDPFLTLARGQQNLGGVAVLGFFVVSGFLITRSGMRLDPLSYIWRRGLRIFPAFWTVLIVTALVVGPIIWLVTGNVFRDYFTRGHGGPLGYMIYNADLTIRQWGIHDIFATTTPYGELGGPVFNGSLWTLEYEWACYLLILVLAVLTVLKRWPPIIGVLAGILFVVQVIETIVPGTTAQYLGPLAQLANPQRITLTLAFLVGGCAAVFGKRIPMHGHLALAAGVVAVGTLLMSGFNSIGVVAFGYLVLYAAARLPAPFQRIGAVNDYSYGIYIYGFLVQQITAFFGWYQWGYVPWTLTTLVITAGLGWLSWHLVEKRAMQLKDWGPGRGLPYWWGRIRRRPVATGGV